MVTWAIDTRVNEESLTGFTKACRDQGHKLVELDSLIDNEYLGKFTEDECVVFRGSIDSVAQVKRELPCIPGVYCDMEKFACTNYYAAFGSGLLNNRYTILPYGDLLRCEDDLYRSFGLDNSLFIRPNRGNKVFTGQLLRKENFYRDIADGHLGYHTIDPWELCVVSPPRNVTSEWRFVVVDNKIITGSQYMRDGKLIDNPVECGEFEMTLAGCLLMAADYSPHRVWVLDVCRAGGVGNPRVLEVNSFSCSGLYGCNTDKIVREVSRVALEERAEYDDI